MSERARQQGQEARAAGAGRGDNPFGRTTEQGQAWDAGYLAADVNPAAEPGWVHVAGCACGRCDGKGGQRNCGDCGATPSALHMAGCDVERCALCGEQAITCGCIYEVNGVKAADLEDGPTEAMYAFLEACVEQLAGRLPWTGSFPGTETCIVFGWYARLVTGQGWVPCEATDEGAHPDVNRLSLEAAWDATSRTYKRRVSG